MGCVFSKIMAWSTLRLKLRAYKRILYLFQSTAGLSAGKAIRRAYRISVLNELKNASTVTISTPSANRYYILFSLQIYVRCLVYQI